MSEIETITADEIQVGDYVLVRNPHRSTFALKVDKIGMIEDRRIYIYGRQFSIATLNKEGLVAFNRNTKIASLRPTTTIERVSLAVRLARPYMGGLD